MNKNKKDPKKKKHETSTPKSQKSSKKESKTKNLRIASLSNSQEKSKKNPFSSISNSNEGLPLNRKNSKSNKTTLPVSAEKKEKDSTEQDQEQQTPKNLENSKNSKNSKKAENLQNIENNQKKKKPQIFEISKKNTITHEKKSQEIPKETTCDMIFFKRFNKLIEIGSQRLLEKQDMGPLPPGIHSSVVKKEAIKILKKGKTVISKGFSDLANFENITEMSKNIIGNRNLINFFKKSGKREKHVLEFTRVKRGNTVKLNQPITDISQILYTMIKEKIKNAIFLKALENIIIIALTVLLRVYIPVIKDYSKNYAKDAVSESFNHSEKIFQLLIFPAIALVLSFIRYLLKEHSAKFVNQSVSKAGQTLRALLFLKIKNSNISFLKNADNSVIAKMTLFDFEIILGYVGKLPDLFSFPIIFVLSVAVMVYFVSFTAIGTFIVFVAAWVVLIFITKVIARKKMRYEFFGSQRATVIMELIDNLKQVKLDKAEILFKNKIEYLRLREEQYMNQVNKYRAFATFIMDLTPLFSILLVLWFENLRGSSLDLTTTYTVVSIISNMNKPLKRFVNILDRYYEYHHAKESLNRLLFLIPDKPKEAEYDESLNTGEVVLDQCKVEMVKDQGMKKALGKIFGDEINLQQEMNLFSKIVKKAKRGEDNDHLEEENLSDNPKIRAESAALLRQSFTKNLVNRKKSNPFPQVGKKTIISCLDLHIEAKSKVFFINAPAVKESKQEEENYTEVKKSHPHHVIHSLLGETYLPFDKSLRYKGKIVYQNLTKPTFLDFYSIRDNILFGEIMIKSRYKKILKLVGLVLENFPGGDQFEILFKGNNLSITERKKILLARMLYVSGDIYILEGFFSGSDSRKNNYNEVDKIQNLEGFSVEKDFLWEKLTGNGGFLEHKTVIVVEDMGGKLANIDNYSEIIRRVDKIVVFGSSSDENLEGIMQFNGVEEYENFYKDDDDFAIKKKITGSKGKNKKNTLFGIANNKILKKPISQFQSHNMSLFDKKNIENLLIKEELNPFKNFSPKNLQHKNFLLKNQFLENDPLDSAGADILKHILPGMIKVQERKLEGRIESVYNDKKIYKMLKKSVFNYIFILGKCRFIFQFCFSMFTTSLFILINIYTGAWSNDIFEWDTTTYMLVYLGLSISTSIIGFIRDLIFTNMLLKNAKIVHERLIRAICSLYLNWFELNFGVNIPFLLSYDIRRIDEVINVQVERGLEALVFVIGGLFLINWIYIAITLIISILCGVYLWRTMKKYFSTSTALVQFIAENTATFQDVIHLTMEEIFEYRVMKCEKILENKFQNTSNEMQRAMTHLAYYCKRWLGVRIGIINTILIFQAYMVPIIVVVFFHKYITLTLLELALVISWSLKLVGYLTSLSNCAVSVFNDIVSFGRIEHFLEKAKLEKIDSLKFKPKVENINYMVYMDKISVTLGKRKILDNITFKMKKGRKVGLLGESGSGKHSLCNLLMRIYDADKKNGKKSMNESFHLIGKETEDVNHFDQRKKIGYLSSNPVLFSGTVRENIDPGYNYSDAEIMSVLKFFDGLNVLKKNFATGVKDSYMRNLTTDLNFFFERERTKINFEKIDNFPKEKPKMESIGTFLDSIPEELQSSENKKMILSIERKKSLQPIKLKDKIYHFTPFTGENHTPDNNPKNLETESAQILLTDFENHLITGNLETEFGKSINNPLHQSVTLIEKKIISGFLQKNVRSSKDFPISVVKLIKIVKIILEKPLIYIVDKSALEFSPQRSVKETMCLFMSSTPVKKSSVLLVFNTIFDYMYLLDEIVMMEKGTIVNSGGVEETLQKWLEINKMKQFEIKKSEIGNQRKGETRELVEEELKLKELILSYKQLEKIGGMIYMMNVAFKDSFVSGGLELEGEGEGGGSEEEKREEKRGGGLDRKLFSFSNMNEFSDLDKKMQKNFMSGGKMSELNDRDSDLPKLKDKMEKYSFKI